MNAAVIIVQPIAAPILKKESNKPTFTHARPLGRSYIEDSTENIGNYFPNIHGFVFIFISDNYTLKKLICKSD